MTKREELIAAVRALLPEDVNDWLADNITDAVLAALREPDEGMLRAGASLWVTGDWDHWEDKARLEPEGLQPVWQAMLAAISPPEGMGEDQIEDGVRPRTGRFRL